MKYTLVYDSGCGPCVAFRKVVAFLDPRRRMRYVGLAEAEREGLLDAVPQPSRFRSFHLISEEGAAKSGPDALPLLAGQLPAGALASRAMRSSRMVNGLAGFAYGALSRLHGSGGCALGSGWDAEPRETPTAHRDGQLN